MEQQYLDIQDGSGDKEFFTIIPNYIANHSSAIDQSLYFQLKRLAGDGKKDYCYPSYKYLMKQMKVGKAVLRKSFKYLIEHKWIEDMGKRQVHTGGGIQWVGAYRINNIWAMNTEHYKGGLNGTTSLKGGLKSAKGGLDLPKGGLASYAKEERKKELKEDNSSSFKSKKPFCVSANLEARFSKGKWWALPKNGGAWLEVVGGEKDIIYK